MKLISGLTNDSKQKFYVPTDTRLNVEFYLYYCPTQRSWYFNFTYDDIEYNGHKLVLGANILRCYKNLIPFGLKVQADKGIEPFELDDFITNRVKLAILNSDEVREVERVVFNSDD